MKHAPLTVRTIRARAVRAPMKRPLGTSAARMTHAPLVLVDVETQEGVTGCAYAFCYLDIAMQMLISVVSDIGEALEGERVDPGRLRDMGSKRYGLLGTPGVVGMALAAIDVAFWDALSCAAGQPLSRYLGAEASSVLAYNSNGLSIGDVAPLADEAQELLEPGFTALKIRLGRHDAREDLAAVRAVRGAVPGGTKIMSDFNQALSVAEAIERGLALDGEGLEWIEEPVAHDDLVGCAEV
ncbi:MAG TPA: enolase C-terminal domain-like protein, partial [Gammaproteobacteria bacterium]